MSGAPWFDQAEKYLGVHEVAGMSDNKEILSFFRDAGHPEITHDETAWCAAFVGAMLRRSGYKSTNALNARSYEHFGEELEEPRQGCIVVMSRGSAWQGHVTFFDKFVGKNRMRCLGGNQSDSVCFSTFTTDRVLSYRWPTERIKPIGKSKIAQGATVAAGAEAVDAGVQTATVIEQVKSAKDTASDLGLMDYVPSIMQNPRILIAILVIAIMAGVIYWRWKEHSK